MKFIKVIFDVIDVFHRASEIRQEPDLRKKSFRFAITSIINALFAALLAYAAVWCFSTADDTLLAIFLLAIGVVLAVGVLVLLLHSLVRLIAQFTLNLGFMTWFALVADAAIIAVAIYLIMSI